MIGRSGERGSGISVLAARHDDDDDFSFIYTTEYPHPDYYYSLSILVFFSGLSYSTNFWQFRTETFIETLLVGCNGRNVVTIEKKLKVRTFI